MYVDKVSTNALDTRILDTKGTQGTQAELDEMRAARHLRGARHSRESSSARSPFRPRLRSSSISRSTESTIRTRSSTWSRIRWGAFYGQAPSSIIYLGAGVFRGEGPGRGRGAYSGGANIARFNKDVVAHETGHQWWGSVICNANQRNYWFVETLAEVSSALYVEKVFGKKKYDERWRSGATTS